MFEQPGVHASQVSLVCVECTLGAPHVGGQEQHAGEIVLAGRLDAGADVANIAPGRFLVLVLVGHLQDLLAFAGVAAQRMGQRIMRAVPDVEARGLVHYRYIGRQKLEHLGKNHVRVVVRLADRLHQVGGVLQSCGLRDQAMAVHVHVARPVAPPEPKDNYDVFAHTAHAVVGGLDQPGEPFVNRHLCIGDAQIAAGSVPRRDDYHLHGRIVPCHFSVLALHEVPYGRVVRIHMGVHLDHALLGGAFIDADQIGIRRLESQREHGLVGMKGHLQALRLREITKASHFLP